MFQETVKNKTQKQVLKWTAPNEFSEPDRDEA